MTPAALVAAGCVAAALLLVAPARRPTRTDAASSWPLRLARWTRWAREPASPRPGARTPALVAADPALVLELVAAALVAGSHPAAALTVTGDAVGGADGEALRRVGEQLRLGAGDDAAWRGAPPAGQELRRGLALSTRTGAPASGLLRERAAELRRRRRRTREACAQRLGVRLVLPLGLCALPAFAAWGVVPVVLGLARQLTGT